MSRAHLPTRMMDGTRLQSGIPSYPMSDTPGSPMGLLLRGVVVATYVVDDPNHFQNDGRAPGGAVAVYCDVLSYTNISGMRWRAIPRCLVLQNRGGIHSGRVWKPRAATIDTAGGTYDGDKGSNPASLDGDHVLVGFMDDALNEPVILGGIPHPSADTGATESAERRRLQLRIADGDPDFFKHHGSFYGIDTNGDFLADTRFANNGSLTEQGYEPAPPTDGSGAQRHYLPLHGEFEVSLQDMSSPEAPVEKVNVLINQTRMQVVFVDSALVFVIDAATGLVKNGSDAASDPLVLNSKMVDDMDELRDRVSTLAGQVEKLQYPLPLQMMPLIPNPGAPYGAVMKNGYLVDPITGSPPELGTGPKDVNASVGDYTPGLVEDGGSTGDLASERVMSDK